MSRARAGRDVVQETFGGALYQQGRGFYSALELLAILRGEVLLEAAETRGSDFGPDRVLPVSGQTEYLRAGHDYARRLLVGSTPSTTKVFANSETLGAVAELLRGLEAPVPGRRRAPDKWQLRHFYPYPSEAIHYDAVERRKAVSIERYQFRGAGGLAHKVLRTDPNEERLRATRDAFRRLLRNRGSAVGLLLQALASHDESPVPKEDVSTAAIFRDDVEERSLAFLDRTDARPTSWMQLLREGVHRILTRAELSDFERVDGLMQWVPLCVAMHQLAMARRKLEKDETGPLVFDAGHVKSPVRSLARAHLGEATATIKNALLQAARHAVDAETRQLTQGSPAWWKGPRTFFATTMFAVGALNAHTGHRHFEVRPQLLQTIVHALVDEPLSLERFSREILGERLRMICNIESGSPFQALELDNRHLQDNGESLADRLDEVGLLRAFSDSTLMVGVHE